MELIERILVLDNETIKKVFGELDVNVKRLEKLYNVSITNRGDSIKIRGDKAGVSTVKRIINSLSVSASKGKEIDEQTLSYLISVIDEDLAKETEVESLDKDTVCLTTVGKPVKPKTLGQKKYLDLMKTKTIVFGIGPAGTGKTFLAMAKAITAFKNNEVGRIILTRPAIEAGENLGFLPGDLQQKVDPYLRPLYDALYQIMGAEAFLKNMEKGLIEVAPLAYMRGRTLDNAFIVLDEAQNTTKEQMKMFLTRIGFGSKVVVTGDLTQIDLGAGKKSGLNEAVRILEGIDDIGIIHLTNKDVVRHPLVQRIILAYEKEEKKAEKNQDKKQEQKPEN